MTDPWVDELLGILARRRADNFELHRRFVNPGFVELLTMAGYGRRFVRGRGTELEGDDGRRYLDFLSGFGVLNLGHNHPRVKAALQAVLELDAPGFTQIECELLEGLAAERLVGALPAGLDKVFFCNSGSEAVEAAIKLARAATGRSRLLSCEGGYHGLSLGALSLHGNPGARRRFEPLLAGVERIPFDDVGAVARGLAKKNVAAFVVEPILGEGGAVVPSDGYLTEVARLCQEHGTLLVVDEVQTGMGRTGRMLAVEHWGVVPDVVTLAKSLGGGLMPVGACVSRSALFASAYGSPQRCHDHETTFGGGPLAMAAVLATLSVLDDEGLLARAAEQGDKLRARLAAMAERFDVIAEVRGRGLMLGIQFRDVTRGLLARTLLRKVGQTSAYLFVQSLCLRLIEEHGIVVQGAVNDPGVLKVMPPLAVTDGEIDRFVAALEAVLTDTGHVAAVAHLAAEAYKRWKRR